MCFGTFDLLHLGHIYYLEQAKKFGDYLIVVVARDATKQKQGKAVLFSEHERMRIVGSLKVVDKVVLGNTDDFFKIIVEEKPHVLCLGYDQFISPEQLRKKMKELNVACAVHHIGSYKPKRHKSSILKLHTRKLE